MSLTPRRAGAAVVAVALALVFAQPPTRAIPAFARKFQVNCYTCHTLFPRLNKMGYLFKRNGYRMPPDRTDGAEAPPVKALDAGLPWKPATAFAFAGQGSVARVEAGPAGATTSRTDERLDSAALIAAGTAPGTGLFYFGEYLLYSPTGDHGPELTEAVGGYVWGRSDRSIFLKAGKLYLVNGEGFRASDPRGVMPWAPLMFSAPDPFAFTLNQRAVGLGAGATWSTPDYRRVAGLSARWLSGLDAKGQPLDGPDGGGRGQLVVAGDYLFGNDSGVSGLYSLGRKEADVRAGGLLHRDSEAREERWGLFASHLVASELDLAVAYLGGRASGNVPGAPDVRYATSGWFAEASYYPEALRGFVFSGRWEGSRERQDGLPGPVDTRAWSLSAQKALLKFGDLSVRAGFRDLRREGAGRRPAVDRQLRLDVRYAW